MNSFHIIEHIDSMLAYIVIIIITIILVIFDIWYATKILKRKCKENFAENESSRLFGYQPKVSIEFCDKETGSCTNASIPPFFKDYQLIKHSDFSQETIYVLSDVVFPHFLVEKRITKDDKVTMDTARGITVTTEYNQTKEAVENMTTMNLVSEWSKVGVKYFNVDYTNIVMYSVDVNIVPYKDKTDDSLFVIRTPAVGDLKAKYMAMSRQSEVVFDSDKNNVAYLILFHIFRNPNNTKEYIFKFNSLYLNLSVDIDTENVLANNTASLLTKHVSYILIRTKEEIGIKDVIMGDCYKPKLSKEENIHYFDYLVRADQSCMSREDCEKAATDNGKSLYMLIRGGCEEDAGVCHLSYEDSLDTVKTTLQRVKTGQCSSARDMQVYMRQANENPSMIAGMAKIDVDLRCKYEDVPSQTTSDGTCSDTIKSKKCTTLGNITVTQEPSLNTKRVTLGNELCKIDVGAMVSKTSNACTAQCTIDDFINMGKVSICLNGDVGKCLTADSLGWKNDQRFLIGPAGKDVSTFKLIKQGEYFNIDNNNNWVLNDYHSNKDHLQLDNYGTKDHNESKWIYTGTKLTTVSGACLSDNAQLQKNGCNGNWTIHSM